MQKPQARLEAYARDPKPADVSQGARGEAKSLQASGGARR